VNCARQRWLAVLVDAHLFDQDCFAIKNVRLLRVRAQSLCKLRSAFHYDLKLFTVVIRYVADQKIGAV
jgi:hypothetical protein